MLSIEHWIGAEDRRGGNQFQWVSSLRPVPVYNWYQSTPPASSDSGIYVYCGGSPRWYWYAEPKTNTCYPICETDRIET
ncbi:unnamed protein product [Cyprideis torosa]|uniref:Uncharacterized protein n=1 Tax=Cyprideis torosa TaxID=163714 RepID=A0A7R8WUE9_9CRUS|nr:unnamed protein product [Cyprideis torosa]CAG0910609.1 unnamed protein product [Cyprideis torosa]